MIAAGQSQMGREDSYRGVGNNQQQTIFNGGSPTAHTGALSKTGYNKRDAGKGRMATPAPMDMNAIRINTLRSIAQGG